MYIVAIDVGVRNLAMCVYDLGTNRIVHWENSALTTGRYVPAQNVCYVREFINRNGKYFLNSSCVLVERQMRANMRVIEAVFQTLYYDRCLVLHPRSVKMHYNLCTKNYRMNKAKAIEWAQDFVDANPHAFEGEIAKSINVKKRDDLADSLLLLMYYLDTYSTQLQ